MNKNDTKDLLYEQVGRIGKAVSSPKRLELIDLLAQGEKSVEQLANEISVDVKLASAHLRVLREARLVTPRKKGKFVMYRLTGNDVACLWVKLREVAEGHLGDLKIALTTMLAEPSKLIGLDRDTLLRRAQSGDVVVIDVRPKEEYDEAHLPHALSMPIKEISRRLSELPKDKEIIAYCRGPFCMFSEEAYQLLRGEGYRIYKMLDGVSEWQAAGMPLAA